MGYSSKMLINISVLEEKVDAIRNAMQKETDGDLQDFFGKITIDDAGTIYTRTYSNTAKWSETQKFAKFLAPFVCNGELEFYGEDGFLWGYGFEKGMVYELKYRIKGAALVKRTDSNEQILNDKSAILNEVFCEIKWHYSTLYNKMKDRGFKNIPVSLLYRVAELIQGQLETQSIDAGIHILSTGFEYNHITPEHYPDIQ